LQIGHRTYSKHANVPPVRSWRLYAQLDIAAVLDLWKSKSALSVLFEKYQQGRKRGQCQHPGCTCGRYVPLD
jgi:hypothetical protein